jgi:hypothetical protein
MANPIITLFGQNITSKPFQFSTVINNASFYGMPFPFPVLR